MAKNKTPYLVLLGSIQDTSALIPAGEQFTPETTEQADELLEAGIIGPVPAPAKAKPTKAAKADDSGGDNDADAGNPADADATQ